MLLFLKNTQDFAVYNLDDISWQLEQFTIFAIKTLKLQQ
jgi:hypothetical protein